jgi:hypothetical protein
MGSALGTSGTKPDSAEDSEDMSQGGEDTGECEVIVMGRVEGEPTHPSCLGVSQSAYLVVIIISKHFRADIKMKNLETRPVCSKV